MTLSRVHRSAPACEIAKFGETQMSYDRRRVGKQYLQPKCPAVAGKGNVCCQM